MVANHGHSLCQGIIIREQGTSIPKTSKGFGRKKAGTPNQRGRATASTLLGGSKALSGILDDGQAMPGGNSIDCRKVGHLPKQAHGQDSLGMLGDGRLQERWIHVVGGGVDVHKHGFGSHLCDHFSRADPGKRNRDHFIARPDPQGPKCYLQTHGSTAGGDAVTHTDIICQHSFKLLNLGAHDELGRFQHLMHAGINV